MPITRSQKRGVTGEVKPADEIKPKTKKVAEETKPKTKKVAEETKPKTKKVAEETKPKTKKVSKETTKKTQKVKEDKDVNENKPESPVDEEQIDGSSIYDFTVQDIDGNDVSLKKYEGHVCLIVNVASACGHTKVNYEQLVELHKNYADSKGLRILAFPCNQYGSQEKGTNEKIKEFAAKKGVEFDMFAKIDVKGKNASPLYTFLINKLPKVTSGTETGKDIKWNFTKFIVNKEGEPVERYHSTMKPVNLIESLEKLW